MLQILLMAIFGSRNEWIVQKFQHSADYFECETEWLNFGCMIKNDVVVSEWSIY